MKKPNKYSWNTLRETSAVLTTAKLLATIVNFKIIEHSNIRFIDKTSYLYIKAEKETDERIDAKMLVSTHYTDWTLLPTNTEYI